MSLTRAQREERRAYIGGTDMAALAGLSRWSTPIDVWVEKTGPLAEDRPTAMMALGHVLEPIVASLFTEATGLRATRPPTRQRLEDGTPAALRDRLRPWLGGRPDRYVYPDGVLECKWGEDREAWGTGHTGGDLLAALHGDTPDAIVPPGYRIQLQHYLGLTGRTYGFLAVLLGYADFRWYVIPRDDALLETLRAIADDFWHQHVLAGVEPAPDGTPAYGRWLRDQRLADQRLESVATPEQFLQALEVEKAQAAVLDAQKAHELQAQRLQASMGATTTLRLPDGRRIHWRPETRTSTAWKAVAEALGADAALVAANSTTVETRPFRVPWPTTISRKEEHDASTT